MTTIGIREHGNKNDLLDHISLKNKSHIKLIQLATSWQFFICEILMRNEH